MRINFGQVLVGLDKKPLLDENKQTVMLGNACGAALCAAVGEPASPSENVRMWKLAMLVTKLESATVSAEDVSLMKQRLSATYAPLIAGQAAAMLENDEDQPQPAVRAA